ncbi:MAG: class I SAM-dependent methyltransferase [Acidobacteriota bacterium]
MEKLISEAIEQYAEAHTEQLDPIFDELKEETYRSMSSPGMQVGRVEGTLLKTLVAISRSRRALEIGMFTGYSGLMIAAGLPDGGSLITCDVDPKAEAIARRYFARSPHGSKIEVRMGPALETISTLQAPIDFVFIDADKENYSRYYDAVIPLVPSGGLIVADNVLWSGKVLDPREPSDRAIVAFNDRVASDPRVEKVLLSVRDGMFLIRKK